MTALYWFYNTKQRKYGQPFGLCARHRETQRVPEDCELEQIAEEGRLPCAKCAAEQRKQRRIAFTGKGVMLT